MADFWSLYEDYENIRLKSRTVQKRYRTELAELELYTNKDFLSITPAEAHDYRKHLTQKGLDDTTKDVILRIFKSIGTYMETAVPGYQSPFTTIPFFQEVTFYQGYQVPTLEEVSILLSRSKETGNKRAFLALTLALKLCLTASEIIAIVNGHFKNTSDGIYLEVYSSDYKCRILPVPDDVVTVIQEYVPGFFLSDKSTPLFRKEDGEAIKIRQIQRDVKKVNESTGDEITLQQVRLLGIHLLLESNKNKEAVASFLGVSGRWLFRYENPHDAKSKRMPSESVKLPNIQVFI